ncbi:b(0,+)-type amino acid transporter 1-like isoform X2 [Cimex lectularius]|nr:b(0,+)-type amino acid transporter 1-like isoform X2 [Cimex lectularius]
MLRREIGLFSAVGLIVSVMIGSGIFITPKRVIEKSGSVALCLIIWAVCGIISYIGALAFAELSIVVPSSGAEYAYFQAAFTNLHRFFGSLPSFIYVWVIVLLVRPAEVAILVLTFSEYVYSPIIKALNVHLSPSVELILKKLIALFAITLITYINYMSVKLYVKIQNIFSSLKVLACVAVIFGGIYCLARGNVEHLKTGFQGTSTNVKDLVLAIFNGLWAYDGWTSVTVVTEEIKQPQKNIPMSISIGVPLITILYFMMNVSYFSILSPQEIIASPAVATLFAEKLFGPVAFIIPLAVAFSTFGCGMSVQFGVARLCLAAGRAGHLISCLSFIHIRKMTPAPAVMLQGILAIVFIMIGNITALIEFVGFLIWIFYGLAMVALLIMRHTKPDVNRTYKVPLFIPIFICGLSLFLAIVPLVLEPAPQYIGAMIFIALGTLAYYIFIYKAMHPSWTGKITCIVQILCSSIPAEVQPENFSSLTLVKSTEEKEKE